MRLFKLSHKGKRSHSRIAAVALAATLIPATLSAQALPGYSHDPDAKTTNPDWMGILKSNTRLHQISIPGTHDSLALYWGDAVQTQSMSLQNQLMSGIRVLDIRLMQVGNAFFISHGMTYQGESFTNVLDTVNSFLSAHPDETVFMRVKKEEDTLAIGGFEQVWLTYWRTYANRFWNYTNDDPMLSEIRGKIVVFQDFASATKYGLDWNGSNVQKQDNYNLGSNWDLYTKWTAVKDKMFQANSISPVCVNDFCLPLPPGADADGIFVNFLSGSGGAFPYFVASGKSSPATNAPRLLTGRTTPIWNSWPDFPRVNCVGAFCSIAFEGTNNLAFDWLNASQKQRVGIMMADFPGPGLIDKIIQLNAPFRNQGRR